MARLPERPLPPHPDTIAEPHSERCDRAHVERAALRWTNGMALPNGAEMQLTLCRYHSRKYEIPLRMGGWTAEELSDELKQGDLPSQ